MLLVICEGEPHCWIRPMQLLVGGVTGKDAYDVLGAMLEENNSGVGDINIGLDSVPSPAFLADLPVSVVQL